MSVGQPANPGSKGQLSEYDVFLSYNGQDQESVKFLIDILNLHNLRPYFARFEMRGGEKFMEVLEELLVHTQAMIACYGPNGLSRFQQQEIEYYENRGGQHKIIPVLLPGVDALPTHFALYTRHAIKFTSSQDTVAANQLIYAITGRDPSVSRSEYLVHIEVPLAERCCYLALGPSGAKKTNASEALHRLTRAALQDAGIKVWEPNTFVDGRADSDIVAIRSAAMMIADCTLDPETGNVDPAVMYQLGIGAGLGKPRLLLTDSPAESVKLLGVTATDTIEFRPGSSDWENEFQCELVEQIKRLVQSQRPPFLTHHELCDIYATRSDVFHSRVACWVRFQQILKVLVRLKEAFRKLADPVHQLHNIVEPIAFEPIKLGQQGRKIDVPQRLRKAQNALIAAYDREYRPILALAKEADGVADKAIQFLLDKVGGEASGAAKRAQHFYRMLKDHILEYDAHVQKLIAQFSKTFTRTTADESFRCLEVVKDRAEEIQMKTNRIMQSLLEIIGSENGDGESSDDYWGLPASGNGDGGHSPDKPR